MSDKHIVVISPQGEIAMTHRDDLPLPAVGNGQLRIRRASHIEPGTGLSAAARAWLTQAGLSDPQPNQWWADMTPVAEVVLGPFASRAQALQAESDWLQEHLPCLNLSTTSSSC